MLVMKEVCPYAIHKYCVNHLCSNFKKMWKTKKLRDQVWKCAKSTIIKVFNDNMERMKELNDQAWKWLIKPNP